MMRSTAVPAVLFALLLSSGAHALQIVPCERGTLPCARRSSAVASALRLRGGESTLWTWWKGLLSKLGLFSKTGKLLVLGLDNAGKSTLLTLLIRDEVRPHTCRATPTQLSSHRALDRF